MPPPPAMTTPVSSSKAMSIGFTVMLFSVSAGIHSGASGFGLLLGFAGVLAGANLVAVGARMGMEDNPAVLDGARALAAFMRRNAATVGLVMASCAVTVASGETEPVLCFAMFALLLLGVCLINVGVGARGE